MDDLVVRRVAVDIARIRVEPGDVQSVRRRGEALADDARHGRRRRPAHHVHVHLRSLRRSLPGRRIGRRHLALRVARDEVLHRLQPGIDEGLLRHRPLLALDGRDGHLRRPRRDPDRDRAALVDLCARAWVLPEDDPFVVALVRAVLHRRMEAGRFDLLLGVRLRLVDVVVDRHLRRAGQLLPDEEAGDDGRDDEGDRDEPRPDRPALVAGCELLLFDHRRRGGRSAHGRRDHRCGRCRHGCSGVGPTQHLGRGVDGGCRDAGAARDSLEVGLHLVRALVAVVRILGKRPQDDHVELGRDVGAQLRRWLRRVREVLHRDLDRRLAVEGRLAGQELVEDDAERVQIGARIDLAAAGLLGGEVLRRPHDRARLGHLAGAGPRDPEVRHLHAALAVGLMSRWTMPCRCAKRSAERIWRAYSIATLIGAAPRPTISSLSVRPSRNSIAM